MLCTFEYFLSLPFFWLEGGTHGIGSPVITSSISASLIFSFIGLAAVERHVSALSRCQSLFLSFLNPDGAVSKAPTCHSTVHFVHLLDNILYYKKKVVSSHSLNPGLVWEHL